MDSETGRRRPRRSSDGLAFGLIMVVAGGILLMQQFGEFSLDNWWALFILIPTVSAFAGGWRIMQAAGRITPLAVGTILGGLFPLLVALIFLLELDWSIWWPGFVILGGFGMLLGGLGLSTTGKDIEGWGGLYQPWLISVGLGALALGFGFLLWGLEVFDPTTLHPRWWAFTIMIAALGGLLALVFPGNRERGSGFVVINLAASAIVAAQGLILAMGWLNGDAFTPSILIIAGVALLALQFFRRRRE